MVKPRVAGVVEGNFGFEVDCHILPRNIALKLILFDQAGQKSDPALFTFNCGRVQVGNYDKEQETDRSVNSMITLNFFILDDQVTELAEGATYQDATDLLGKPQAFVHQVIQGLVVPDMTGIWDQCGIGFELSTVQVVHLRNVLLKDGKTLESIFVTDEAGMRIADPEEATLKLEEAIPILNVARQAQGRQIAKDDRNVFLVGRRLKPGGVGWADGIRVAIIH